MFRADRVFSIKNPINGKTRWYFQAREGDFGPYESKEEAKAMLKDYIEECIKAGNNGGRNHNEKEGSPSNYDFKKKQKPIVKYLGKKMWY